MTSQETTEAEHIQSILRILREAKAAIENDHNNANTYRLEDFWVLLSCDENEPIPPQVHTILQGRASVEDIELMIGRYEQDLHDLQTDFNNADEPETTARYNLDEDNVHSVKNQDNAPDKKEPSTNTDSDNDQVNLTEFI